MEYEKAPDDVPYKPSGRRFVRPYQALDDHQRSSWDAIEANINRFLEADIYVISTPMWNFGIPYVLKAGGGDIYYDSEPRQDVTRRVWLAEASLVSMSLIWGVNYSVIKFGTGLVPPLAYNAVRITLA